MKRFFSALLATILTLASLSSVAATKTYTIQPETDIFASADTSSEVLLTIDEETNKKPIARTKNGKFYKINVDGTTGYIRKSDLVIAVVDDDFDTDLDAYIDESASTTSSSKSSSSSKYSSTSESNASTTVNDENDDSRKVYITDTGSKYHSSGCRYLKKSKHAIGINTAKKQGYSACSRCHP